ncbi:site-specific tyrosine recombinase/integron integrase [Mangrovibacterium diazotrophicum]|uniref:Site-specific recombinase XerD n=1 Tax=Mangrovibacterium diazotrophicum TaxID=1261403 RepID=A0A419W2H7_9BACT|nr:site-specific tyrosine recombinase/integron integrase [Mangrovibacterium diazotrophicum]RKD89671.1 site-specific recombinase XerD [Mangrovibacterium diazotrophicum]
MPEQRQIKLSYTTHRQQAVVRIDFAYDAELAERMKMIDHARWSQSMSAWYVPQEHFDLHLFFEAFRGKAWVDYEGLKIPAPAPPSASAPPTVKAKNQRSQQVDVPPGYQEMLEQKRYSLNTQKIYISYMRDFTSMFHKFDLKDVTKDQINRYILWLIREKGISASQQNQRINAIKFYYEKVLGRPGEYYDIERPRKSFDLPKVLSENEVLAILRATENIKHKAILGTIYSAGLRRSELINLRIQDVQFDKHILYIRGAKGKKDRTSLLSDSIGIVLQRYMQKEKPNYWLFESPGRTKYSTTSIARILHAAVEKAGIRKRVTPHMLRHSFATHMLEQGVDIRYIQTILGHESSKTTEIYTHVSTKSLAKIKSPLDMILKDKTQNNNDL